MATSIRSANRRSTGQRATRRVETSPVTAHDQLVAVKVSLEAIHEKLNRVNPDALTDDDHARWSDQINQVDLAIARARNSLLNGIIAEFAAALPSIQASTARAEADLQALRKAVDIINAVSGLIGVIEQIVRLGR